MNDSQRSASDEHGITDADRDQIEAYLRKPAHSRSVDDLRRRQDS
jgi:hypothetical protein